MTQVSCVAITLAKPGCENRVEAALAALIEPVRREKGVIQYEMHRDLENPRRFVFIELWEDRETFDAHCAAPHIMTYLDKTRDLIEHSEFFPMERLG